MIDLSFEETVQPGYRGFRGDPSLSSSLGASFYFGARFWSAGFFDAEPWYGAISRPAPPREVCLGMIAHGGSSTGRWSPAVSRPPARRISTSTSVGGPADGARHRER